MLPRFCKLCYQIADESIIKLRRFSMKHSKVTSETYSDDEYENEEDEANVPEVDEEPVLKNKNRKLIIKCKRASFNFYEGDTYPKFQPIPLASRAWQHRDSKGDYFTIYPHEDIPYEETDNSSTFRDINLHEGLLKNLEDNNIIHPTAIQKLGIPVLLDSQNAVLAAETGCGKTYAFLIPLLQQILQWKPMRERGFNTPLGLILTPSRELTTQISKVAKKLTKNLDIKIVTLTGGKTKKMLFNPPVGEVDLIVATLGVLSKLVTTNIYKMDQVRHVVIDEADTIFDKSFNDTLCNLLNKIPIGAGRDPAKSYPSTAQLTLNSATIPQNLSEILNNVVDTNSLLPVTTGHEHQIKVPQKFLRLGKSEKPMTLLKLVKPKMKSKIPIIIFSNTAPTCDFISIFLKQFNISCINLHGDMPVEIRRGKFMDFQNAKYNVLSTTDAGGRGLDTIVAKDVINYDFPLITSDYIHRCGRTGRIGSPRDSRIINFISRPLEIILTKKIEFAARKMNPIPMVDLLHNNTEGEFLGPHDTNEIKTEPTGGTSALDDTDTGFPFRIPQ